MNLFRSEEHARRWQGFNPGSEDGFIALPALIELFGTESRRHWLEPDYLSRWLPQRPSERREILERLGKGPFWLGA